MKTRKDTTPSRAKRILKKENYFINDDGLCVCIMSDIDSVYDTLAGHYKHCYGVVADDFDEDGIHKDA